MVGATPIWVLTIASGVGLTSGDAVTALLHNSREERRRLAGGMHGLCWRGQSEP